MNADRTATVNVSAPIRITEFAGSLPIVPDNALMALERCNDWLMIRTAATANSAAPLNPANALSAGTMPAITATIRAAIVFVDPRKSTAINMSALFIYPVGGVSDISLVAFFVQCT